MSYRYNAYSQNGYALENGYNQQNIAADGPAYLPFEVFATFVDDHWELPALAVGSPFTIMGMDFVTSGSYQHPNNSNGLFITAGGTAWKHSITDVGMQDSYTRTIEWEGASVSTFTQRFQPSAYVTTYDGTNVIFRIAENGSYGEKKTTVAKAPGAWTRYPFQGHSITFTQFGSTPPADYKFYHGYALSLDEINEVLADFGSSVNFSA